MTLVIRRSQIRAFRRQRWYKLEGDVLDHVQSCWPEFCATREDVELRQWVGRVLGRARSWGFRFPEDLARFVDLAVVLGPDFDRKPWAAPILRSPDTDRLRMERLLQRARREIVGHAGVPTRELED